MRANFCSECGEPLQVRRVAGLARTRASCRACEREFHQHPQILLTCFVSYGEKLLWLRRALEPKRGLWAIPGGFREPGESLAEGAAREVLEETGVILHPEQLEFYMTGTITFINQIYIAFRATVDSGFCLPGDEALAVGFFDRGSLPWREVAYPEVNNSVERAYADLESGVFGTYHAELTPERNEILAVDVPGK
ncbi:MAG: 8-oxo-dGTP diphosphatase [Halieaceae bacterium]|jgi:8-oxo-dGTP diphosphatase